MTRTRDDVAYLRGLIDKYDGISFARAIADRHALEAGKKLRRLSKSLPRTDHLDFMHELVTYVSERRR
jgi:geranylgeranyl pyrophosphate synthase